MDHHMYQIITLHHHYRPTPRAPPPCLTSFRSSCPSIPYNHPQLASCQSPPHSQSSLLSTSATLEYEGNSESPAPRKNSQHQRWHNNMCQLSFFSRVIFPLNSHPYLQPAQSLIGRSDRVGKCPWLQVLLIQCHVSKSVWCPKIVGRPTLGGLKAKRSL